MKSLIIILNLCLLIVSSAGSQTVISGVVTDRDSHQPLPAANIQISGTYRGTITNQDGFFTITIPDQPSVLLVSYIGFESKEVRVGPEDAGRQIDIGLNPVILEGETITIIAEDPGMRIMREVIKRKLIWRKALNTYRAKAYSRIVLENDSGIVSLAESTSELFWDRERGTREVIKTKDQSSNLDKRYNLAFASQFPNFYDDDISISGYTIVGPTHPDAFDYYTFKLLRTSRIDQNKVYHIEVIPDTRLQPTFEGTVAVLDSAFALLEAELIPNETVRFPVPIQTWSIYYTQQFRNYGREFWLPVDLRMDGSLKIGFPGLQFPNIIFKRIASLDDYDVNIDLPDSLYQSDDRISVDSIALAENKHIRAIPLSRKEDKAYNELDSTMTMEKAFKPSGFLASMLEFSEESERDTSGRSFFSYLEPSLWYNRADGLYAGINIDEPLPWHFSIRLGGGYHTGHQKGGYHIRLRYSSEGDTRWHFDAAYSIGSELRYPSFTYSRLLASSLPLFALDDYFDYYWNKALRLESSVRIRALRSSVSVSYYQQEHSPVEKNTDFNIIGSGFKQRPNPAIETGSLRAIGLKMSYGQSFVPLGIVGQKLVNFYIDHCIGGSFDYTTYRMEAVWRVNTFLTRRLMPNALDIMILAGTNTGNVPIQKFGALDAAFYQFGPFGTFRSLYGRPYEGEKYAALFWEHNFRTVPFELIGFDFLVEHGIGLIVYGAHGRTWISQSRQQQLIHDYIYTDQVHHEAGLSINGILGMARLDFTQRIDKPAFYVGFGLTRFF